MQKALIILLFISGSAFGQEYGSLKHKAWELYRESKYDSALIFYKEFVSSSKDDLSYNYYVIGDCYKEIKNYAASEKYFQLSMSVEDTLKNPRYFPQRLGCLGLADLYIETERYGEALNKLRLAEDSFPYIPVCGTGEFGRRFSLANKFSICFEQLNMLDSVISHLTPFLFRSVGRFDFIDSTTFLQANDRYVDFLSLHYSPAFLKTTLSCELDAVYYNLETKEAFEKGNPFPDGKFYYVDSYLIFLGAKVQLLSGGFGGGGPEYFNYHTKAAALERVRSSPIYNKIMDLPDNEQGQSSIAL